MKMTGLWAAALWACLLCGPAAADYCDKQPSEIDKARCRATLTNRNIPEDVKRAEASATHIGWVYWATLSPDGKLLASAGKDQTVKLWDFESGKFIRNLGQHDGWVRRVAFRPDGKAVYAIADNEGLTELDVETGKTLRVAPLPPGENMEWFRMALSPDGSLIALKGLADGLQLWDVAKWAPAKRLAGDESVESYTFAPTSGMLMVNSKKTTAGWNPETGERFFGGSSDQDVSAAAFSPDGSRYLEGGEDKVRVWDLKAGEKLRELPTKQLPKIFDLAMTPDNSTLITCTDAPSAFDMSTGKERVFGAAKDNCHSVTITADGKLAITTHNGSDIRVWDIATGALQRRFGEPVGQ